MNKLKYLVIATVAAVAFLLPFVGASANTNGIDVSSYQGSSQSYFSSFKAAGEKFVIVKAGGRGGGEGYHYTNPLAATQIINADRVGMQTATYFWGQFGDNVADAQYSAQLAVADSLNAGLSRGSYIALDYEAGAGWNVQNNTSAVIAFMDYIHAAGFKPMLYSGNYYMKQYINLSRVNTRYPNALWVASYPTTAHQAGPNMNWFPPMSNVKIWQYADNHYGVDGNVMVNGSLDNNKPVSSTTTKQYKPGSTTKNDKAKYVTFNGVYVADYWTVYNGKVYGVNNDMSIKPTDYNNFIPISAMTLTDRYGHKLSNQYIRGNDGTMEYFTLNGKYKVLKQTATQVEVEISGEPVSLQKAFVTIH